jgi:hypothetical protein
LVFLEHSFVATFTTSLDVLEAVTQTSIRLYIFEDKWARDKMLSLNWCGGIALNYRLNLPKLFVQSLGRNRATVAQFLGKEIACPHEQNLGKNHAILELFLGNSSWQIDERQNLCAPPWGCRSSLERP